MPKSVTENLSVNNLDFKQSVRAATTANITLSGTQTIDGVVLVAGDRVLVKNQNTASQNGIYVVNASTWNRSLDANEASEFTGNFIVFVEEGTLYKDTGWILITNNPITVGSTSLSFTLLTRASDSNGNIFLIPDSTGDVGISTLTPNARLHVYSSISGDTVFNVEGTNGSLFSITDNLTGSLMSVNNNAGLPVFEVFSTDKVVAGRFGQNDLVVNTDGKVGLGTTSPSEKLEVSGNVKITQATVSTSTATGTLILSGTAAGAGIAGNINVGGTVNNFSGNTASTSTGTGTLVVTGGVGVSGNVIAGAIQNTPIGSTTSSTGAFTTLSSSGATTMTAGTASTSTATGTLVVTGGVGVSGNVYSSSVRAINDVNGSVFSFQNSNTDSQGWTGYAQFNLDGNSRHTFIVGSTSGGSGEGGLTVPGYIALDGTYGAIEATGAVTAGRASLTYNVASTSHVTGTLVVTGGVGVSGNINCNGNVNITGSLNNTPASNIPPAISLYLFQNFK